MGCEKFRLTDCLISSIPFIHAVYDSVIVRVACITIGTSGMGEDVLVPEDVGTPK
jgi:hypothetical protein